MVLFLIGPGDIQGVACVRRSEIEVVVCQDLVGHYASQASQRPCMTKQKAVGRCNKLHVRMLGISLPTSRQATALLCLSKVTTRTANVGMLPNPFSQLAGVIRQTVLAREKLSVVCARLGVLKITQRDLETACLFLPSDIFTLSGACHDLGEDDGSHDSSLCQVTNYAEVPIHPKTLTKPASLTLHVTIIPGWRNTRFEVSDICF